MRQAGRISIPEGSFDTIREARDLHREGLGTEAVRKRLAEGEAGLTERLDSIAGTLEELRENLGPPHGMTSHEALRTILARQTLLISAVSDLTGMVEDLLAANDQTRRRRLPPVGPDALPEYPAPIAELRGGEAGAAGIAPAVGGDGLANADRRGRFGTRRRRRRWGVLGGVAVAALLACAVAVTRPAVFPEALTNLGWRTEAASPATPASPAVPDEGGVSGAERRAESPGVGEKGEGQAERGEASGGGRNATEGAVAEDADVAGASVAGASVAVPDVSGLELGAAAQRLREDGLRVPGFSSGPGEDGEVVGTRPEAGARVEPGSPVVLVVGDGSPVEEAAGLRGRSS